jgi:hypothetical protein
MPSTLKWETKGTLYTEMGNKRYPLHLNGRQKVLSTLKWETKDALYIEMRNGRYLLH